MLILMEDGAASNDTLYTMFKIAVQNTKVVLRS